VLGVPMTREEITEYVTAAVGLFLRGYGYTA
jgi:hypothetical protein